IGDETWDARGVNRRCELLGGVISTMSTSSISASQHPGGPSEHSPSRSPAARHDPSIFGELDCEARL
ncbi:MAG: hypothetical protein M3O70_14735, partial [Actinomycetota bacterium]|nr:hypothetical protein [Actinomycetota bacterium]